MAAVVAFWYATNQLVKDETTYTGGGGVYRVTYSYDPVGNRTGMTDLQAGVVAANYTYDAANELTSIAPLSGTPTMLYYDNNGNLTVQQVGTNKPVTYSWDYENRLKTMVYPDGTYITNTYDVDWLRWLRLFRLY